MMKPLASWVFKKDDSLPANWRASVGSEFLGEARGLSIGKACTRLLGRTMGKMNLHDKAALALTTGPMNIVLVCWHETFFTIGPKEVRTFITHFLAYHQRGNCFRTEDISPTDDRECTRTWLIRLLRRIAGTENKYVCETLLTLFYFPTISALV